MSLVQSAANRPVAVSVGAILVILFGILALVRIPIQLTPDVRKPTISVETDWPGASPQEMEQEVTLRLEEMLKAVPGMVRMTSSSNRTRSKIDLEFTPETDMDSALVLVSNRLQRVRDLPEDAERPIINTADSDDTPITWIMLQRLDPKDMQDVSLEFAFVEEVVRPALERVRGVAVVNVYGGRERELRITVDPVRMASRGITVGELADVLKRENMDISAGTLDEGKRAYVVRTVGQFSTPADVEKVVVRPGPEGRVTIADIGEVAFASQDPSVSVRGLGRPAMAINCVREHGANVLSIMADVYQVVERLNEDALNPRGLHLIIRYDQTEYIHAAIDLVKNNLFIGAVLAMAVLLFFLRSLPATIIIAVAIPISVIGAFLAMALVGKSINVVSLAGLAFAVGMVVDPAIVALENIVRLRASGLSSMQAAVRGTSQVWGAIFISTITTVAVFLPILSLRLEAAQLFGDIAVALCAAVLFSMVIATTVIPTLGARLVKNPPQLDGESQGRFLRTLTAFTHKVSRSVALQLLVVALFIGGALFITVRLLPPAEYLPEGNRNLIFAMLLPPPGYNLDEMTRMAEKVEGELAPYWNVQEGEVPNNPEKISMPHFFFVARGAVAFMGGKAHDPKRASELIPIIRKPIGNIPGTIGIVNQASLFARGIGQGRALDLTITGPDLEKNIAMARQLFGMTLKALPGAQVRPIPGLELGNPELRLTPDRVRARDNGLSTREIGQVVDAFTSGLKVDDVIVDGREIDLVIRGNPEHARRTQDIGMLPLATPTGRIIPVSSVTDIELTAGPVQIDHFERERAVSLRVNPPGTMAMETAAELLDKEVIAPTLAQGLPPLTRLRLTEGADQLRLAKEAMTGQFLLALAITFLLMAALFESFLYPVAIIVTVPLATAGGVLGLWLLNLFVHQPLDVLTMLGFVILIGVVVNNAILIVHQALNFMNEEGMSPGSAVTESVRIRVRPIFLSTFTSIFGMLPLVVFPGAGSELYRGLGSVVVGGLLLSTLVTLVLVPALFSLLLRGTAPTK